MSGTVNGEWVEARLTGAHGEKAQLARHLGIGQDKLTKSLRGGRRFTPDEIALLQQWFSEERPEAPPAATTLIPIYDVAASAGHGSVVEYEQQIDSLALPRDYLRKLTDSPQSLGIISVKGDSMAPTLRGGDFVLVDVSKTNLAFDGLFVLDLDGALHVKRVARGAREGVVRIVSDNRTVFEPFEREIAEVRVVGKVLLTVRRE